MKKPLTALVTICLAGSLFLQSTLPAFATENTETSADHFSPEDITIEEVISAIDTDSGCDSGTYETDYVSGEAYDVITNDISEYDAVAIPSIEERRNRINSAVLNPMRTNSPALDALIDSIFARILTPDMDTFTKVKACYDYLIRNFTYAHTMAPMDTDYESSYDAMIVYRAYASLSTNQGVCTDYASAFVAMTRAIGLESYVVGGQIGRTAESKLSHAWVNIRINGQLYLFDPQVEDNVTTKAGNDYINYYFFCMLDSETWSGYDYDDRDGWISSFNNFKVYRDLIVTLDPPKGQYMNQDIYLRADAKSRRNITYELYIKRKNDADYTKIYQGSSCSLKLQIKKAGQYLFKVIANDGSSSPLFKELDYTICDAAKVNQFITRLYRNCLGRSADAAGLQFWCDKLAHGEETGASIAYQFAFSKEYLSRNTSNSQYLEMLYTVCMGRSSDMAGKAYWNEMLTNGVGRAGILNQFARSAEFRTICASYGIVPGAVSLKEGRDINLNVTCFVNRLYQKALGRKSDTSGLNYWCQQINSKAQSPVTVAEQFFFVPEFTNKHLSDEDFVKVLYRTFMDREYDNAGLSYWKKELANGCSRKDVMKRFAGCPEFQNIMKSFGL